MNYFFVALLILFVILGFIKYNILNKKILNNKKESLNSFEIGRQGEQYICDSIEKKLDIYYKLIRNVYIPIEGKKTEIDILLVTSFGIYVIESKNYHGTIYGDENDFKWTQYFSKQKTYQLLNPIKQNNYHIQFLSDYLRKDKNNFKSYIVFGKDTIIKKIKYNHLNTTIANSNWLIEYLRDDMHHSDIIYSHEEIDKIYIDLKYYCEHSNLSSSDSNSN